MFLQVNWTKLLLALLLTLHTGSYCDGFPDGSNDSFDPIDQSDYNHVVLQPLVQNSSLDTFNNCTSLLLMSQKLSTNSSCSYVQQMCKTNVRLINYMSFALCNLEQYQPLACVIIALWLAYLIALLASTVDNFLVSPLTMLSDKLKLPPSTAGSTLMAFGNGIGAPDIFVIYCGISQDDFAFVLGAMSGGAIFMITVIVGSVILVSKIGTSNIKKLDFTRDVVAYMVVTAMVIIIAYDGKVHLFEAIGFLIIYCIYISSILTISYAKIWWNSRKTPCLHKSEQMKWQRGSEEMSTTIERSLPLRYLARTIAENRDTMGPNQHNVNMPGLTWPRHAYVFMKIVWIIQWPFVLLQWLTIPSCCCDGHWSKWNFYFTCFTPTPLGLLLLTATCGWGGYALYVGKMPLVVLIIIIGMGTSILLLLVLNPKKHPNWFLHFFLTVVAFAATVIWLNIIANEIVSALQALGLLINVNTAIIGLTILAVSNSAADWVAEIVITRAGKPEMALACCFSAPLIGDALGLSIALIVKLVHNSGKPIHFSIQGLEFFQVKLAWIFLGVAFLANLIIFPIFKFNPPRLCSVAFFMVYGTFVIFLVLSTFHLIPPIM